MKLMHGIAFGLIFITLPAVVPGAFAAAPGEASVSAKTAPIPAAASAEDHIRSTASQIIGKHRRSLVKEAIDANDEMLHAIMFIGKKNTRQAYKMLEKADGQLSVLMARDPHLKLAPINVRASINDLESSPNTIQKAVKDAKEALDNGQIQAARSILSSLVSEMYIDTDYLPLEIYPDAIKKASKEIQESKLKEADATLADVMSSIVTTEDAVPLPPLKAEGDVLEAERLRGQDMSKNKDKVLSLLRSADDHLANAVALGYGNFKDIRDEIAALKSSMETGTAKEDAFRQSKKIFHAYFQGFKGIFNWT